MVKWLGAIVGMIVLAVASVGAVFVLGMRTKSRPVIDTVRRINKGFTNPRVLRSAGSSGVNNAVIHHVGRSSGRAYETPIVPFPTADGFVIALPYGLRADWARNVLAAGTATLVHEGRTMRVDRPEVVPTASVLQDLPSSEQRNLRIFGVTECLAVRLAAEVEAAEVGATEPS